MGRRSGLRWELAGNPNTVLYLTDVLGAGNLMYKATNHKKARTYAAATLPKRIRKEHAPGGDVKPI
jgi:hypothetical protein